MDTKMPPELLIQKVQEWGDEKGITNFDKQLNKVHEGTSEFWSAVTKGEGEKAELLELGDILVTVILAGHIRGIDPLEALEQAYIKIKARDGKNKGGTFIKEEDLND